MKLIAAILLAVFIWHQDLSANTDSISMRTGETRGIDFSGFSKISVSRKGIISLTHDHGDRWILSANRAGFIKIQATASSGQIKLWHINVTPRSPRTGFTKHTTLAPLSAQDDFCKDDSEDYLYTFKASIELADKSKSETVGWSQDVRLLAGIKNTDLDLKLELTPKKENHKRQIVANPMVITRACNDVVLRSGGEDGIDVKTDDGRTATVWKSHGVELKLKIIPTANGHYRVPFSVALRTPSKGQGAYGLSDVQSTLIIPKNEDVLAAAINLSSVVTNDHRQVTISDIPIIGPLFKQKTDMLAESIMLVWFHITQRSVTIDSP
jgi:hypothetical protein